MERTTSATEARSNFGEIMRWAVEKQDHVFVERAGKPHVVVLSVDEYNRLLAGQKEHEGWKYLVDLAREQIRVELGPHPLPRPEEIIREMREERDAQLLALR
jgi:prevent-host-death family protein